VDLSRLGAGGGAAPPVRGGGTGTPARGGGRGTCRPPGSGTGTADTILEESGGGLGAER
jgi:hypothetical protein